MNLLKMGGMLSRSRLGVVWGGAGALMMPRDRSEVERVNRCREVDWAGFKAGPGPSLLSCRVNGAMTSPTSRRLLRLHVLPATALLMRWQWAAFSGEVVLNRCDPWWLRCVGSGARHHLYPVHVSGCLLATPSLAAALYLMLFRFVAGQYEQVIGVAEHPALFRGGQARTSSNHARAGWQ